MLMRLRMTLKLGEGEDEVGEVAENVIETKIKIKFSK